MHELTGIIDFNAYMALEIYGLLRTEKPKAKQVVETIPIILTFRKIKIILTIDIRKQKYNLEGMYERSRSL